MPLFKSILFAQSEDNTIQYPVESTVWKIDSNYSSTASFYCGNMNNTVMVDWGDGTVDDISYNGGNTISHDYSQYKEYTIIVTGDVDNISLQDRTQVIQLIQGGNSLYYYSFMCHNCTNLKKIDKSFCVNENCSLDFQYMFANTFIEEVTHSIFKNIVNSSTSLFNYTFNACQNLLVVDGLQLPVRYDSSIDMFSSCYLLQTVNFEKLYKNCGFNSYAYINTGWMFNNCSNLTSYVPPQYFWQAPEGWYTQWSLCFGGCTNIENYDQIPNEWK